MAKAKKSKGFLAAAGSLLGSIPAVGSVKNAAKKVKQATKKTVQKVKKVAKVAKKAVKKTVKKKKKQLAASLKKAAKKAKKKAKKKIGKVLTQARKLKNNLSPKKQIKKLKKNMKKAVLTGKKVAKKVKAVVKKASMTAIKKETMLNTNTRRRNSIFMGRVGSGILIGTEITAGAFQVLESQKMRTVERGTYGNYNVLKFHVYENGLIIKEFQLGTRQPIQYVVVNKVEEEFDDGGVRNLDGYFEGTALVFVDYIHPQGIIKKSSKCFHPKIWSSFETGE